METGPRLLAFRHLPTFDEDAEGLMDDEDLREVQRILNENPFAGVVVPGAGGVRKLRVPLAGRGKRGGARLIYLYVHVRSVIYLITVYAKSDQADISAAGRHLMARLAKQLKGEP